MITIITIIFSYHTYFIQANDNITAVQTNQQFCEPDDEQQACTVEDLLKDDYIAKQDGFRIEHKIFLVALVLLIIAVIASIVQRWKHHTLHNYD
jgi:hypothetical protein